MTANDITTTVSNSVARQLVAQADIVQDTRGRWVIPDEAREFIGFDKCWQLDEALTAALVIIATRDEISVEKQNLSLAW